MREAMRKNQEKLEAWKALLKEEVVEQQEVAPVEETNALPNDVKTEDGNPVVEENSMPKDVNAEDVNKQTIEGSEKASEGENAPGNGGVYADNQGNPVDADGKLIVDEVNSIDEITDEDFETPTRNVQLPAIPENVANAIGANGRPVVIKKNVFEKNGNTHVELEPEDSRNILRSALYNPNLVGSTQPIRRPDYKVAIRTGEKNAVVVLDVYQEKDFVEIVGWRMVNEKGLAKMQRQAEMEGGQFLILSPNDGSAAALSALPLGLSSASEDTNIVPEKQEKVLESDENNNQTPEDVVQQAAIDTAEKRKEDALKERIKDDAKLNDLQEYIYNFSQALSEDPKDFEANQAEFIKGLQQRLDNAGFETKVDGIPAQQTFRRAIEAMAERNPELKDLFVASGVMMPVGYEKATPLEEFLNGSDKERAEYELRFAQRRDQRNRFAQSLVDLAGITSRMIAASGGAKMEPYKNDMYDKFREDMKAARARYDERMGEIRQREIDAEKEAYARIREREKAAQEQKNADRAYNFQVSRAAAQDRYNKDRLDLERNELQWKKDYYNAKTEDEKLEALLKGQQAGQLSLNEERLLFTSLIDARKESGERMTFEEMKELSKNFSLAFRKTLPFYEGEEEKSPRQSTNSSYLFMNPQPQSSGTGGDYRGPIRPQGWIVENKGVSRL